MNDQATTDDPDVIEYTGFRDLEPDGVLEQPFWERYNSRLEVPISISLAILIPVAIAALVIFFNFLLPEGRNTNPVAMTYLDGEDDRGIGSPGSGGEFESKLGEAPSVADMLQPPSDAEISKVKEEIAAQIRIEGVTDVDVSDATAAAIGTLNEDLRKKIAGVRKGSGKPGSGGHEGTGTGVGGTGADSTRARALRWVIKFDTRSGHDYVEQIAGLGGVLLLQHRDDNSKLYIWRDPRRHSDRKTATDADLHELGGWLRFEDIRRQSVEAVADAFNLGYVPPMFLVYFNKELEKKLDTLERQYQNRDPREIRETVYRVVRRGGSFDLIVINQILK